MTRLFVITPIVYAGLAVVLAAVALDAALCVVCPSRRCRGCWSSAMDGGRRVCAAHQKPRCCRPSAPAVRVK